MVVGRMYSNGSQTGESAFGRDEWMSTASCLPRVSTTTWGGVGGVQAVQAFVQG